MEKPPFALAFVSTTYYSSLNYTFGHSSIADLLLVGAMSREGNSETLIQKEYKAI
jgi:hypothetical protein